MQHKKKFFNLKKVKSFRLKNLIRTLFFGQIKAKSSNLNVSGPIVPGLQLHQLPPPSFAAHLKISEFEPKRKKVEAVSSRKFDVVVVVVVVVDKRSNYRFNEDSAF